MGQLLFIASADAGSSLAPQNVYLSGANGNDANDGLTPATAVATFGRVWELLPLYVQQPFVVHIGAHGGGGYAYELPPDDRFFAEGAFIVLYGDGAGQAGEDGFVEVASGVAGASTNSLQLELAVATTLDNYRHLIIEFTTGVAAGYRRTVRDNSTTVCYYTAATENISATLTPAPGDSYRILRQSVQINLATTLVQVGATVRTSDVSPFIPMHLLFVSFNPDQASAYINPPDGTTSFGVNFLNDARMATSLVTTRWGADDSQTREDVLAIYAAIGRAYVPQEWHGVGLSFGATAAFNSSLVSLNTSQALVRETPGSLYGFITAQGAQCSDKVTLRGGSFSYLRAATGRTSINTVPVGPVDAASYAAIKVKSTSSFGCIIVFAQGELNVPGGALNTVLDLEQTVALNSVYGVITNQGYCNIGAACAISYGFSAGYLFANGGGNDSAGNFLYIPGNTAGFPGLSCGLYLGDSNSTGRMRDLTGDYSSGITLEDNARLVIYQGGSNQNVMTCTGRAALIKERASLVLTGTASLIGGVTNGGALELQGGVVTQKSGTLTVTNTNGAATSDAIRVSGGGEVNLLGGASTPINVAAAGGYGVNARFGGHVYFAAQPTIVGGGGYAGDLIVDTGAGAVAAAALAASESSTISATNGSLIARAN